MRSMVKWFKQRKARGLSATQICQEIIKAALRKSISYILGKLAQGDQNRLVISASATGYRQLIGTASMTLPSWEWLSLPRDIDYVFLLYKHHLGKVSEKYNFQVADKVVVEIGPGSNLGLALCLIANGASKVYCVDKYHSLSPNLGSFYQDLVEKIVKLMSGVMVDSETMRGHLDEAVSFQANQAIFNPEKLAYICPCDAAGLPLDDATIDLLLSHAVLEHVSNLRGVISENARVLKPGGYVSHQVDFRDHRNFDTPFDFLRYSSTLWKLVNIGGGHLNRVRPFEYLCRFSEAGFELLDCQAQVVEHIPQGAKEKFNKEFRKLTDDEISVLRFHLIARPKNQFR